MNETNGNTQTTTKAADDPAVLAALDAASSVKRDDFATGTQNFIFPAYGYNAFLRGGKTLPPELPSYSRYNFYTQRDWTLLSTVHHESMWANAVATAVTKASAWGWEVEGVVALRRKRLQELLQYATAGVFVGWVPFLSAHLRSYLLSGRAVVEIQRETTRFSSRITGINHLNPLRCRFTDNPRKPVQYLDRQGKVHELDYWQVMIFGDQLSPTEGDVSLTESSAERAYSRIITMEAVHLYLYEKITGNRPLSFEFIQGLSERKLRDAVDSANDDKDRKGSIMFKGVIAIPVPGDIPIQRVTIPIAEVPDGFNYQEIHDNTAVDYAMAIGADVNDIDPRIAAGRALGTGAQSIVLDQKARGKGLAAWRVDWTQQIHRLVASTGTTFAFSEDNVEDETKKAQLSQTRANTRKIQQEIGEIDQAESRNLAVDAGDLPASMLDTEDKTSGGVSESDDNPNAQNEQVADQADQQQAATPQTAVASQPERATTKAKTTPEEEALRLLQKEQVQAFNLARALIPQYDETPSSLEDALGVAD